MRYQKLGNTDIDVSVIALGTWGLGGGSVWTDRDSTVEDTGNLLDSCREYGINYIDTAPVYGTGASEELLGKALKGRRQDFILQSKCSLNWRKEGGNCHEERDGYTVNNDTRAAAVKSTWPPPQGFRTGLRVAPTTRWKIAVEAWTWWGSPPAAT